VSVAPTAADGAPILTVRGLSKVFGGIRAIDGIDMDLARGECLGIIGPNGAGKTALVNVITGFYTPTTGEVTFGGASIAGLRLHRIARLGIARTYQNIRIFRRMTVLENVLVALKSYSLRPIASLFGMRADRAAIARVMPLLERFDLVAKADALAATLAYGEARRLEIVRALATSPRVLLLDEPAAGMNEEETAQLVADIRASRDLVEALILIEHDMELITALADRVLAMENGRRIAEGPAAAVLAHPRVREAYLGT
jgi:branched-chain amino acid transport system ATP-binding protein